MEPPTTHTINSNIKPFSYVNSTQCLELIDQYISDEVDYKSTHIPFLKQISISYQQPPVIPCYPFDICQTYQVCINNSQLSNYKGSINKKDIRKKDRNACKKVNLYAFNCLQSLVPSKDLRGIKKFIHRADFFMTVLVIAQNLNIWSDFQSLYRVKQSVEGHKIKQMMKQKDVQYCFKKSLTCMKIFETGDIESAINELFDVKTLKCKAYLSESKERIRNLFGLSNEESIQQQYVKKRIIKKLMSSDFNN